jgi:DNA-binding NtrC family response regulator
MSRSKPNLLIVDDDAVTADMIAQALEKEGYGIRIAHSGAEAMDEGKNEKFDLVLTDLRMPELDGMDVLNWFRREQPSAIVVLMTAFGSSRSAIDSIQQGAYDYVSKPFKIDELRSVVRKALSARNAAKVDLSQPEEDKDFEPLIGRSQSMIEIYKIIGRAADSDSPVLILGETGSGKELIARALYEQSNRRSFPFLAINCSALTESLLESELFGHEKGAFTGAVSSRAGIFESAGKGVCFLDEISETSLAMQSRLLRVLQNGEIKRVGSNQISTIHARILAASNKDLASQVEKGLFRQDLYYRLNAITILVPPLRERRDDLPELIQYFLNKYSSSQRSVRLSQEAYQRLLTYDWPGNIRELEHVIQRAIMLTPLDTILADHLNLGEGIHAAHGILESGEQIPLEELEKRYIRYIYLKTMRNKARTADILGIDRKTLYSKLAKYCIEE